MNNIKNLSLAQSSLSVVSENSSLKLQCKQVAKKLFIDITNMSILEALNTTVKISTYCFLKKFKYNLCWIVGDEEIKKTISVLNLKNSQCICKISQNNVLDNRSLA